jgi:dihydropyrimidinase
MYDLVVRGGTVVTGDAVLDTDIAVADGRIAALGSGFAGAREIDAEGKLVFPAGIDPHTHMALPVGSLCSSDDFESGTIAAACGGIGTIMDFTVGSAGSSLTEDIRRRLSDASSSVVDYALHAEVVGWSAKRPAQIREAVETGIRSFKFYTTYESSGRRSENGALLRAFDTIAGLDGVALVHAEDESMIRTIQSEMSAGDKAKISGLPLSRPDFCEAAAISSIAWLAWYTGVRVHIVHVSSRMGLDEVRRARDDGADMTAETCPQYLLLAKDAYDRPEGHLFSAAPALRTQEDQDALWNALADREIDFVATDHCPFTKEQKTWKGSFADLPYGLPGVETMMSLVYSEGVDRGTLTLSDMACVCSENAARLYGLYPRKGAILPGADADLAIFDPSVEWRLFAKDLHMKTDFSPYQGWTIRGKNRMTISRGEVIVEDGEYTGAKGRGRFLPR